MSEPTLPIEFWEWIADHDPERLPFRSEMSDAKTSEVYEHATRLKEAGRDA